MMENFKVTKREILFSVTILCAMVGFGVLISNAIMTNWSEKQSDAFSATRIYNDSDKFDYIVRTNVGNFMAEGTLKTVNPVSLPEIKGKYMRIRKVREEYRMHTQVYTTSDGKGHTQVHTRHYWTWDVTGTETFTPKKLSFLGKEFPYSNVELEKFPENDAIIIGHAPTVRYVYYTLPQSKNGTMTGIASDKSLSQLTFTGGMTIDEYVSSIENKGKVINICFWVVWMILTGGAIFLFYYFENNWLEDNYENNVSWHQKGKLRRR